MKARAAIILTLFVQAFVLGPGLHLLLSGAGADPCLGLAGSSGAPSGAPCAPAGDPGHHHGREGGAPHGHCPIHCPVCQLLSSVSLQSPAASPQLELAELFSEVPRALPLRVPTVVPRQSACRDPPLRG